MKLFSGDQNGIIVLTEIDYYMVCMVLGGAYVWGYLHALVYN